MNVSFKFKSLLVVMLAFVMVILTAAPVVDVSAAGTVISNADNVIFWKFLSMDKGATVPNVSFEFSIEPGTAVAADTANNKPVVMEGPAGAKLSTEAGTGGNPYSNSSATVTVAFKSTDPTYTAATAVTAINNTVTTPIENIRSTDKFAAKAIGVDLTGVTFKEPGIYRYVIKEKTGTDTGIHYDLETDRILDVYVTSDDDGNLTIPTDGYIWHKKTEITDTTGTKYSDPTKTDESADGDDDGDGQPDDDGDPTTGNGIGGTNSFINRFTTNKFTLESKVTGNMGYRSKYFKHTVTLTGNGGDVYMFDTSKGNTYTTTTNPTTVTANASGVATAVFYLKHDESIQINGLNSTTKVKVDVAPEDYTAEFVLDTNASSAASTTGDVVVGSKDHKVTFTFNRSGVVPTGIIVNYMPWTLILILTAAYFIIMAVQKNRKTR